MKRALIISLVVLVVIASIVLVTREIEHRARERQLQQAAELQDLYEAMMDAIRDGLQERQAELQDLIDYLEQFTDK